MAKQIEQGSFLHAFQPGIEAMMQIPATNALVEEREPIVSNIDLTIPEQLSCFQEDIFVELKQPLIDTAYHNGSMNGSTIASSESFLSEPLKASFAAISPALHKAMQKGHEHPSN